MIPRHRLRLITRPIVAMLFAVVIMARRVCPHCG